MPLTLVQTCPRATRNIKFAEKRWTGAAAKALKWGDKNWWINTWQAFTSAYRAKMVNILQIWQILYQCIIDRQNKLILDEEVHLESSDHYRDINWHSTWTLWSLSGLITQSSSNRSNFWFWKHILWSLCLSSEGFRDLIPVLILIQLCGTPSFSRWIWCYWMIMMMV